MDLTSQIAKLSTDCFSLIPWGGPRLKLSINWAQTPSSLFWGDRGMTTIRSCSVCSASSPQKLEWRTRILSLTFHSQNSKVSEDWQIYPENSVRYSALRSKQKTHSATDLITGLGIESKRATLNIHSSEISPNREMLWFFRDTKSGGPSWLSQRSEGRNTVPCIFYNEKHNSNSYFGGETIVLDVCSVDFSPTPNQGLRKGETQAQEALGMEEPSAFSSFSPWLDLPAPSSLAFTHTEPKCKPYVTWSYISPFLLHLSQLVKKGHWSPNRGNCNSPRHGTGNS